MSKEWAERQRRTNQLVRLCYGHLLATKRLNAETIHALCRLTWITISRGEEVSANYIQSTKIPALDTIFDGEYEQEELTEIASDIQEKTGLERNEVVPLICQHSGFTNFYNTYRNSSLDWIRNNIKPVKTILAESHSLKSDNQGAGITARIDALPSILAPNKKRSLQQEYLLTPLCFCLDPRLRFPIINGSDHVEALLMEFGVKNGSLPERYSALVSLLGQPKIKDAADIDQIRTGFAKIAEKTKKSFKLVVPSSKERGLEQKDDDDYEILRKASGSTGRRRHNTLTNHLLEVLRNYQIVEGSDQRCKYDALVKKYSNEEDLLIEVKSSIETAEVRMAIGQLYDYHHQLPNKDKTSMAVLLPKKPGEHVMGLLKYAEVGLLYFEGETLREVWW